jgi:hypothetical protein
MKITSILLMAMMAFCSSTAFAKKAPREMVTVVARESSTTLHDWYMNGRMSVSCYGNSCSGVYSAPASGTQQIEGSALKLQRADSSFVIAQCVAKVNIFSSIMVAVDAVNAGDPNSPTVYRDCRAPYTGSVVEAVFHRDTVKLYWQGASETYSILGFLPPEATRPVERPPLVHPAIFPLPSYPIPAIQAASVTAKSTNVELKTYSFPTDGFSISFPAEPQIDPSAKRFRLRSYIAPDFSVGLYAGISLPGAIAQVSPSEAMLQEAKNASLAGAKFHLLSEQEITLGIYPGIEYESESDTMHSTVRIYLVGATVYQISASMPIGKPYAESRRFLDSFQLIPRDNN